MKPGLQLKATQQLTMTPQLQQAIRLLQLSSHELLHEIQEQLDTNPLLEREETDDNEWETVSASSSAPSSDYSPQLPAAPETLADHLLWQLEMAKLCQRDIIIGYCLINALDDRGYLVTPLDEIRLSCRQLMQPTDPDWPEDADVLPVLDFIQHFEPAGAACRNLVECLRVQLDALPTATAHRQEAIELLADLETQPGKPQREALYALSATHPHLIDILKQLDPAPGETFNQTESDPAIPDVVASRQDGKWTMRLNARLQPRLRVNAFYADMAQETRDAKASDYLRDQLQEARWFMRSLKSRQETLLKVSCTILELQQAFFDYGEEAMKPMVLADVANRIDMHESTISRVTTRKFMQTPHGLYELKYFFSSHLATEGGGECSSTAIRAIIKKLVAQEDPKKPLSDNKLTQLLLEQGIKVARRTIAKYREALRIPTSSERKRLR